MSGHTPRSELQALLTHGDRLDATALARALHTSGSLDAQTALWLLSEARQWHVEGFASAQRELCDIVVALAPAHNEAWHLLGYHAQMEGDFARAEDYYTRALAAAPDYAFSALALSQIRMLRSHFAQGREGYEARFNAVTEASGPDWRGLPVPRWRGEPLEHKKIYLWAEQGLGDIVMFAGFLPYLMRQNPARIALGMFPKLITLFQRSFPILHVEPIDDAIHHALAPSVLQAFPHIKQLAQHTALPFSLEPLQASYDYAQRNGLFDFAAPMGDLLVHAMPGFIPAQEVSSWLVADPDLVATTQKRLSQVGQGRRIGISWHTTNRREAIRNIPLEQWLPVLRTEGCHFISLQHHVESSEITQFCAAHHCNITVDSRVDLVADGEGLAALIASMDEVITIDNSNAHLAGALGIPTTILLPKGHNYRWPQQENGGTLWYKKMQVLRQHMAGDWDPVMQEVVHKLACKSQKPSEEKN